MSDEDDLTPEQRIAMAKAAAEANHAAAERERGAANHVRAETEKERAKTDREREEHHIESDERLYTEYRRRVAALVRAARVKVNPVGLAITLVVGVAILLLLLRYA